MKEKYIFSPLVFALLACLALTPPPAFGQYVGPGGTKQVNVGNIHQHAVHDSGVVLRGNIHRKTTHEQYLFTDGSGSIAINIPDEYFPSVPVNENTPVIIYGKFKKKSNRQSQIEVRSVKVIDGSKKWRINQRTRMRGLR